MYCKDRIPKGNIKMQHTKNNIEQIYLWLYFVHYYFQYDVFLMIRNEGGGVILSFRGKGPKAPLFEILQWELNEFEFSRLSLLIRAWYIRHDGQFSTNRHSKETLLLTYCPVFIIGCSVHSLPSNWITKFKFIYFSLITYTVTWGAEELL